MHMTTQTTRPRRSLLQAATLLLLMIATTWPGAAAEPPARKPNSSSGFTSGSEAATFTPPRFEPPPGAVLILPGTDIQSVVDKHPAGTAFLLKVGVHRLQSILPKDNMSFYGEVGHDGRLLTTLNGANLITKFEREGKLWVITGQTQKGDRTAYAQQKEGIWARYGAMDVMTGWEGTTYCEDVFIDNIHLRHVGGAGLRFQWDGPGMKEKRTVGQASKTETRKMAFDFTKGKGKETAESGDDDSKVLFVDHAGKMAGIKSEFFDFNESLAKIPDLSGRKPDFERIDENIGTDYKINGYVWPGLDDRFADTFASRHTGFLKITKAGKYTFYLSSDDESKLWIDGALVIDNDGLQTLREMDPLPGYCKPNDGHYVMKEKSGSVDLKEGFREIRIEFFKNRGYDRVLEENGTWYFDYGTDRVYIADDPTGKTVEVSVLAAGFSGMGKTGKSEKVIIRNLIVEKFANGDAMGAIQAGSEWTIEGNETRLNHGTGIEFNANGDTGGAARFNYSHDNGSRGIGIQLANKVVAEYNELAFNNRLHYSVGWNAAGIKNSFGDFCILRGHYIHDNNCKGIWIDCLANDNLIEDNVFADNSSSGITVEISLRNKVRNNIFSNNNRWSSYDGSAIYIQSCAFNEVYSNKVEVSNLKGDGINIALGDRSLPVIKDPQQEHKDCYCHDNMGYNNIITYVGESGRSGVGTQNPPGWDSNTFYGNTYHFPAGSPTERFMWGYKRMTFEQFQGKGQEKGGSVSSVVEPLKYEWSWSRVQEKAKKY